MSRSNVRPSKGERQRAGQWRCLHTADERLRQRVLPQNGLGEEMCSWYGLRREKMMTFWTCGSTTTLRLPWSPHMQAAHESLPWPLTAYCIHFGSNLLGRRNPTSHRLLSLNLAGVHNQDAWQKVLRSPCGRLCKRLRKGGGLKTPHSV